ncbi:IS21 ORF1 [Shigella sonnei]|nr:IS21 ORF1 [Shigella sonnei]
MVKYLKENFFVRYRRFDSFTHVNQQLEQWIADVADKRELLFNFLYVESTEKITILSYLRERLFICYYLILSLARL